VAADDQGLAIETTTFPDRNNQKHRFHVLSDELFAELMLDLAFQKLRLMGSMG